MKNAMSESRFDYISGPDKDFIIAFDDEMKKLGYDFGNNIGTGYCWGRYMIIYSKTGIKSKKVAARIYIREDGGIVLRLFLNGIDKHREYIENAEPYIKDVLTGTHGDCIYCAYANSEKRILWADAFTKNVPASYLNSINPILRSFRAI